jgi:hypothetical protein
MVTPAQSHKQAKIINSMDLDGFKKYYAFLLNGGTVEEFIVAIETGIIKVKRNETVTDTIDVKALKG